MPKPKGGICKFLPVSLNPSAGSKTSREGFHDRGRNIDRTIYFRPTKSLPSRPAIIECNSPRDRRTRRIRPAAPQEMMRTDRAHAYLLRLASLASLASLADKGRAEGEPDRHGRGHKRVAGRQLAEGRAAVGDAGWRRGGAPRRAALLPACRQARLEGVASVGSARTAAGGASRCR